MNVCPVMVDKADDKIYNLINSGNKLDDFTERCEFYVYLCLSTKKRDLVPLSSAASEPSRWRCLSQ